MRLAAGNQRSARKPSPYRAPMTADYGGHCPVVDENGGGKRKYSHKGRRKYASFPRASLQAQHRPSRQSPGRAARQTGKRQGRYELTRHFRAQTARLMLPQCSNRCYWLATRKGKPSDLYLKDHLGKKVRNLFYDTKTGTLGSHHELQKQGIYIYASRDLTPAKRQQRWADILRDEYPTKATTILANPHNIPLALKHRPSGKRGWKHKKTWI